MSELINASICLSDIPRDQILTGKNGKKYLSISISERREVDRFGNTHSVYIRQTKEQREAKEERIYIGEGKAIVFDKTPAQQPVAEPQIPSDLPF